jgi:hypothetical protein
MSSFKRQEILALNGKGIFTDLLPIKGNLVLNAIQIRIIL